MGNTRAHIEEIYFIFKTDFSSKKENSYGASVPFLYLQCKNTRTQHWDEYAII